jgi:Na+-driven multidrug efflux pump
MAAVIMVNMMTQTMGRALEASIVALSRQGLFLIPSLFILSPLFGLLGIQLATPVANLAGLVIVIPILVRTLKILSAADRM